MMTSKITKIVKLTIKNGNDITKMKESIIIDNLNENNIINENITNEKIINTKIIKEKKCLIIDSNKYNFSIGAYFFYYFIIFLSILFSAYILFVYYLKK